MLPTGCIERPDEVPGPDDTAQGGNKYDYATTRDIPLNLDYARRGSKALFEIYAQNPVNAVDGAFTLKPGVKALLRAYTDNDGKYSAPSKALFPPLWICRMLSVPANQVRE